MSVMLSIRTCCIESRSCAMLPAKLASPAIAPHSSIDLLERMPRQRPGQDAAFNLPSITNTPFTRRLSHATVCWISKTVGLAKDNMGSKLFILLASAATSRDDQLGG